MHAGTRFANDVISACRKSGAAFTRFAFPTWWHYDVLRGLEYLRNVDVASDKRVAEAIELLKSKRDRDGRWPLEMFHPGVMPVQMRWRVSLVAGTRYARYEC